MDTMLDLMIHHWHLDKPNLLISVTGGAKNFTMRARLKEVFRRGLMKAAESTGKKLTIETYCTAPATMIKSNVVVYIYLSISWIEQ